tara:strand:+ start:360 stop:623 length:264 start_codon:yes stop_codon:yes gene_type:complete
MIEIYVKTYECINEIHCLEVTEDELKQINRGEVSLDYFDEDTLVSRDWISTNYEILTEDELKRERAYLKNKKRKKLEKIINRKGETK